jgi:hypothetical protein
MGEQSKIKSSAPELTDDDKRRIEAEMTVPSVVSNEPTDSANDKDGDLESGDDQGVKDDEHPEDEPEVEGSPKPDDEKSNDTPPEDEPPKKHRIKRFFAAYWRKKKWTIPLTIVVIIGILAAVPQARYPIAGLFVKQRVTITVVDSSTKKPVSSVSVNITGKTFKTDKDGKVDVGKVKVGKSTVKVSKRYYKDTSADVFVPLLKSTSKEITIEATGRQVPVTVTNKITKKPLADAILRAAGTEVKTDKDGKAIIVLPVGKADLSITLVAQSYNTLEARVKVTDASVAENSFAMVPSGKVYFLSRQSGKIDVVKTDLDGANRQTVVYGTGKEDDQRTVLLASRDWRYLTLYSQRDSGLPKLYLVDTSNDKMTTMDEGDATFTISGWSGHNFVFSVVRNNIPYYEANHQAIKKYDADKHQLITMEQNTSQKVSDTQNQYQNFSDFHLLDNTLMYVMNWSAGGSVGYGQSVSQADKSNLIRTILIDDGTKKDVKNFPTDQFSSISTRQYEPKGVYIAAFSTKDSKNLYYKYEDSKVDTTTDVSDETYYNTVYPTYLESPDGKKTFWSEQRDGRDTFFVGDADGKNGKQVGAWEDHQVYGWYTDAYLLLSKGGSELYIMPVEGGDSLKISDYHKPNVSYTGYGGGYGGL